MKKPPPHQVPPIPPDALLPPWLLPYAKKLRNGKAIGFDERFSVPCKWNAKELALIHDGLREWLKHGTFDKLAELLKDDPCRIVHPVIRSQLRHLAKLSRGLEESDSFPDSIAGPFLSQGTRLAARKALETIFQGLWSAFSPGTLLYVKPRKVRGRRRKWPEWEIKDFLEDYNALNTQFEEFDAESMEAASPLRRKAKELRPAYLKRIIGIVQQLHSTSTYGHTEVMEPTGPNTLKEVDTIEEIQKCPLPSHVAKSIAQQAIPKHSVQKHILLAGLFAHYFYKDHTQWRKVEGDIQRAEAEFPHLHTRKTQHR